MKAEDLRIGNLIHFLGDKKEVIEITPRFFSQLAGGRTFDDQKNNTEINGYHAPIPLTPDHLRKFGAKEISPVRFSYNLTANYKEAHQVELICNFSRNKGNWWFEYKNGDTITPLPREIKFVHEFQNFYKEFTGKELISI